MSVETFEQFLRSRGVAEKNLMAFRRVVAWQLSQVITAAGLTESELASRVRTRPDLIGPFLARPESAPLLITTRREAMAATGRPVMTFLDTAQ
jgi:hypothetical protein